MGAELTGIDVSRHQGTVDMNAVAASGKDFAFLKATDGVRYAYVDWFHQHRYKAWLAGLIVGAYHFLLDHHPGAAQARFFVNEVNRSGGFNGIVPIVDIEREADGTTPRESHLRDFVAEFRRLVPNRPLLIYTGRWYWVGVLGNPYGADLGLLWHSEYDGQTPIHFDVANGPELDTYGGWADCLVWQHTSDGRCPGVGGRCDLNLFYGSRDVLHWLAGLGSVPVPTPQGRASHMQSLTTHPDGSRVDLAVIGHDGSIWHAWAPTPEGLATAQFEWLGGWGKSVSSCWANGEYVITVQGSDQVGSVGDNGLFVLRYTAAGEWTRWVQHPTAVLRDPEANV